MKGLLIKDLMGFRKQLVTIIFVTVAVLVVSIMVTISASSGNVHAMIEESKADGTEMAMHILSFSFMALMILPMASIGDGAAYLFREDKRSGFISVASVTPVPIRKRILAKYIMIVGLYVPGAVVGMLISAIVSVFGDALVLADSIRFILTGFSFSITYLFIFFVLLLCMDSAELYAQTVAMLVICAAVLAANTGNFIEIYNAGEDFSPVVIEKMTELIDIAVNRYYVFLAIAIVTGIITYFISVAIATKKREVI